MITQEAFSQIVFEFSGIEHSPHFDRIGFRIIGKRMIATYLAADNTANIFLTPEEQQVFCQMDPKNVFPVPNKWGEKGATTFLLNSVSENIVREALLSAYNEVVRRKN